MKWFHLEVCEAENPIKSENGEDGLHACRYALPFWSRASIQLRCCLYWKKMNTYFRQVCRVVCKCKLFFKNIKAEQNITKWLPHRVLQLAKFLVLIPEPSRLELKSIAPPCFNIVSAYRQAEWCRKSPSQFGEECGAM